MIHQRNSMLIKQNVVLNKLKCLSLKKCSFSTKQYEKKNLNPCWIWTCDLCYLLGRKSLCLIIIRLPDMLYILEWIFVIYCYLFTYSSSVICLFQKYCWTGEFSSHSDVLWKTLRILQAWSSSQSPGSPWLQQQCWIST